MADRRGMPARQPSCRVQAAAVERRELVTRKTCTCHGGKAGCAHCSRHTPLPRGAKHPPAVRTHPPVGSRYTGPLSSIHL